MIKNNRLSIKKNDILFFTGLIAILIILICRAHFGAGGLDESFYPTIAYKILKGDIIFKNEWHGSLLSSFLMLPFVKIYTFFVGSCDGIILTSRIIESILHVITSAIVYYRLRKYGYASAIAVLVYPLFFPYIIQSICYNNIAMDCMMLIGVLIATNDNKNKAIFVFTGFLYAVSCLCQPLIAVFFVIGFVGIFVYSKIKHSEIFKYVFYLFVGILILAIPVVLYLLFKVGINDILNSFEGILLDQEHGFKASFLKNVLFCIVSYFPQVKIPFIHISSRLFFFFYYLTVIGAVVVSFILKFKKKRSTMLLALVLFENIFYTLVMLFNTDVCFSNFYLFPWIFPGIIAFFNMEEKADKKVYLVVALFSMIHTLSFLTSNQLALVYNIGLVPLCIISIMFSLKEMQKCLKDKNVSKIILGVCVVASLFTTVFSIGYTLTQKSFWNGNTSKMTSKVEMGAYKGVYTSPERQNLIHSSCSELEKAGLCDEDNVLLFTKYGWLSLYHKGQTSQYSSWLSGVDFYTVNRLKLYYEINPDRFPKYVYVLKDEISTIEDLSILDDLWVDCKNVSIIENKNSYILEVNR